MVVHCSKIHMASVYIELTDLSSSPSFLLRQEIVYPLLEELVIVNDGGVPMRGVSDPLGAPVVAVALKQDVRVKLKLLLSAQELPDLGRTLGEQPQAFIDIVPRYLPHAVSQQRDGLEVSGQHRLQGPSILAFWDWKVGVKVVHEV